MIMLILYVWVDLSLFLQEVLSPECHCQYGYVQGFMPKTTADVTVIYIGELSNVISAFLDPADMIEKNGEMGWHFVVDYTALPVPIK